MSAIDDPKFEEKMLELVAQAVPVKFRKAKLTREMNLRRDLGIDSLGIMALVYRIEESFSVDLSEVGANVNANQLRTVGDAIEVIRGLIAQASST